MQAQFLVHFRCQRRIVHRKGEHFGHVQHGQFLGGHFDFTRRDPGIARARRALANLAGDTNHAFAAQGGGALEQFLRQIGRIENCLRPAFPVANVNEDQPAEVPAGVDPAG